MQQVLGIEQEQRLQTLAMPPGGHETWRPVGIRSRNPSDKWSQIVRRGPKQTLGRAEGAGNLSSSDRKPCVQGQIEVRGGGKTVGLAAKPDPL